jgi:hypothetical protein
MCYNWYFRCICWSFIHHHNTIVTLSLHKNGTYGQIVPYLPTESLRVVHGYENKQ